MKNISATELARNLRRVLDNITATQEEYLVERNHQTIARIVPSPGRQTALEAMADLYRTLPEDDAGNWLAESRQNSKTIDEEMRNPWEC